MVSPIFFPMKNFYTILDAQNVSHSYDKSTFLVKGWGWHIQFVPLDSAKAKESNEPIQSLKEKSSIFLILLFLCPTTLKNLNHHFQFLVLYFVPLLFNKLITFEFYISKSYANATTKIIIMTFWLAFSLKPFNLFAYVWLFFKIQLYFFKTNSNLCLISRKKWVSLSRLF